MCSKMKNIVRFSIPNSQAMNAQIEVNALETTQILSHYLEISPREVKLQLRLIIFLFWFHDEGMKVFFSCFGGFLGEIVWKLTFWFVKQSLKTNFVPSGIHVKIYFFLK